MFYYNKQNMLCNLIMLSQSLTFGNGTGIRKKIILTSIQNPTFTTYSAQLSRSYPLLE